MAASTSAALHFVHFEPLPDGAQQRDRQPSAQVLAKLVQPAQHRQASR